MKNWYEIWCAVWAKYEIIAYLTTFCEGSLRCSSFFDLSGGKVAGGGELLGGGAATSAVCWAVCTTVGPFVPLL